MLCLYYQHFILCKEKPERHIVTCQAKQSFKFHVLHLSEHKFVPTMSASDKIISCP
jgi:hypothetical protein